MNGLPDWVADCICVSGVDCANLCVHWCVLQHLPFEERSREDGRFVHICYKDFDHCSVSKFIVAQESGVQVFIDGFYGNNEAPLDLIV